MMPLVQWGSALYFGDRSYAVVPRRKVFVSLTVVVIVVGLMLAAAIGFNRSVEFTSGTQSDVMSVFDQFRVKAPDTMTGTGLVPSAKVMRVGTNGIRIQTESLNSGQTAQVRDALVPAYGVDASDAQSPIIGSSWGKSVTIKALQSFVIFMAPIAVLMTACSRSRTMAAVTLLAFAHNIAVTSAVLAITQVEASLATVIGFLTILGYSLYDIVVVFGKVREFTCDVYDQKRLIFAELVNLAVNQTMVRSTNTSMVALLPTGAILTIGSLLLGTGALTDISLALLVGMIAGTYSSIFTASPLFVMLQERMKKTREHDGIVAKDCQARAADSSQGTLTPVKVAPVVTGRRLLNAHQPKRRRTQR